MAVDLAKKPRFRKQALYHTQQSMEDATKGIARAAGISHDDLREHSHNYPYLFFLLLDTIITDSDGIQYSNELLSPYYANQEEYDAKTRLGNMINLTSSPSWTLRILSGISEGICNTMVQSGGEFLYIGVGGR